ncbi:cellulase family glycosylhydrolase [Microbulbifer rhizosphaerae]|uniref:Endoglucanase n=1 Tax=Microbulbifer rhizosphaerae TaxID=1562603 RepID=A0A7W4WCK3_9GAMM|nr:cellulase family glycosylhydrolase [Microbulbifer rhizosphaerae]MBB3061773.1 hypothetical protein [Microbulbifer rhizosphaerae]
MKNQTKENFLRRRWFTVAAALLISLLGNTTQAVEPLTVNGNRILAGGQARSLAGPSFFWSNTEWGGERFYNAGAVSWVKSDWNATLVRAAMGVDAEGGYLEDPNGNKSRVIALVDAAIANDMYVIIDWHSHHAEDYTAQAVAFFEEMAQTYGHHDNVIYEIYNEPLQVSWSGVIKPYAETVISAIRAIDPDNLIIVGTPTWSQDVDAVSWDPIQGYANIAYTLHFYAGTHKQYLRDKAQTALNNGIALFVTEWGAVNADGDGAVDYGETQTWMNFLEDNNLSHANWALNDKEEGASALVPGASVTGGWGQDQLTASGQLVRDIVRNWDGGGSACGGNCPPVADSQNLSTAYQTQLPITLSGSDSDGSITGYTVQNGPANGNLSGNGANRLYTPNSGFSGNDSFTFTATDNAGAASEPATVSITVGTPSGNGGVTCESGTADVWSSGFVLSNVTVTNGGNSTTSGWQVTLQFPEAVELTNGWNGNFKLSADGRTLTVTNIGWNGNLQPGQSASFGFQGNHDGSFQMPVCGAN